MREDWIEVELLEIGEIITGGTPSKKNPEYYTSNDKPFFKPTDLNAGRFVNTSKDYLSDKGFDNSRNAPAGSVLVTCIGATIGKTGLIQKAGAFNQQINAVVPYSICEPIYAFYYISSHSFQTQILAKSSSTTMPILNKSKFSTLSFPLPPLPEQRAIVAKIEELFSSLDNGITNLKKAQEQLRVYRQAVLKKAFEGELTKEWREKQTDLPSAEELLEQIKRERENYYEQQLADWKEKVAEWEENGKEGKKPGKPRDLKVIQNPSSDELDSLESLPSIWIYNYLAYAGKLARGKSKHRPRNDKRLFGGKYPFIQTGEVKAVDRITSYSKSYNDFGLSQSELWPTDTLCITIAANIAETAFLDIPACFPDSIVGYHPFNAVVNKHYVNYFFHSAKARLSAYAPATAQKNINLTTLENLLFPFCSLKEQHQIVQEIESRLSVCDKVEESIKEGLQKAKALKQSILKKAFDGALLSEEDLEACKNEADWEPAEVLLERIKSEKNDN